MYRKILIAYDGSPGASVALLHAVALARKLGAHITALWAKESLPHFPETIDEIEEEDQVADEFFQKLKASIASLAQTHGIEIRAESRAAPRILSYAQRHGFDLIALGASGESGVWGRLLGAPLIASAITRRAMCSSSETLSRKHHENRIHPSTGNPRLARQSDIGCSHHTR